MGRGVIAVSAHFGNFTLIGMKMCAEGYPFASLVKLPKYKAVANALRMLQQRQQAGFIYVQPWKEALRSMFVRRKQRTATSRPRAAKLAGLTEWETKLQQRFATHVAITAGRKGGKVEFEFYSQEDLERLLEACGVL